MNQQYGQLGDWTDYMLGPFTAVTQNWKYVQRLAYPTPEEPQVTYQPGMAPVPGQQADYGPRGYDVPVQAQHPGLGPIGSASVPGQLTPAMAQQVALWMQQTGKGPAEASAVFGVSAADIRRALKLGPAPGLVIGGSTAAVLVIGLIVLGLSSGGKKRRRRRL